MSQVFRGRTLNDAQRAASAALGRDAVILTTRKVRLPGMAGMFGGSEFEITAAPAPAAATATASLASSAIERALDLPRKAGPFAAAAYLANEAAPKPVSDVTRLRAELRGEIRALKSAVAKPAAPDVATQLAAMRATLEKLAPGAKQSVDPIDALLRSRGIEGEVAEALTEMLRASTDDAPLADRFRDALAELVRVASWPLAHEARSVIALVGPSGVGKTTTVAKLAAHAKMDGRSVTLVACDTFRVGAIDAIKRYATLLDARFATAECGADLARVIAEATTDVVLIDTSGRAPGDGAIGTSLDAEAYAAIRHAGRARHVLLCLPAALRERDAARAIKTFAPLEPTGIVATKLDETDAPSCLVHAPALAGLPITTLCFGQRVPEDIAPATNGAVIDYLAPRGEARA